MSQAYLYNIIFVYKKKNNTKLNIPLDSNMTQFILIINIKHTYLYQVNN